MTKTERIRLFLGQMAAAAASGSHDEAYTLIATTLTAVEDEHSGVTNNPAMWETDGRLYPPQPDSAALPKEYPTVIRYRSVDHWTYVAPNGAFRIEIVASHKVLIDRPGRDGRLVEAFAVRE